MTTFRVTLEGRLISSSGKIGDDARKALGLVMAELNKLGWGSSAGIDLNSSTGRITLVCAIEADDPRKAVQPASDNIVLALRAGGIGTDEAWPTPDDPRWRVEFINTRAEAVVSG